MTPSGRNHAFLWDRGVMTDLGTLPGFLDSGALGINDLGQVLGKAFGVITGGDHAECFVWSRGVMNDLGLCLGTPLIRDLGVVGNVTTASGYAHVFLWTPPGPILTWPGVDKVLSTQKQLGAFGRRPSAVDGASRPSIMRGECAARRAARGVPTGVDPI